MYVVSVDLCNVYTMKTFVLPVSFPGRHEAKAVNEVGHHMDTQC